MEPDRDVEAAIEQMLDQQRALERMLAQTKTTIEALRALDSGYELQRHFCRRCSSGQSDPGIGFRTEEQLDAHLANVHGDEDAHRRLLERDREPL
jgi:Mg2+ and Co2+ transporter CorA